MNIVYEMGREAWYDITKGYGGTAYKYSYSASRGPNSNTYNAATKCYKKQKNEIV